MNKHILVIDDEAEIRELLEEFLTQNGFKVSSVSSKAEALAAVGRGQPDLIISDLQLEDADGLEMITKLKSSCPGAPVILLTGVLFEPAVVEDVLSSKVACYLPKTSPLKRILEAVRRLLGEPSSP